MATIKRRLNITLSPDLEWALAKIAKRDHVPEATKAAELIQGALLIEEDSVFERLVSVRDKKGVKFVSHEQAWK